MLASVMALGVHPAAKPEFRHSALTVQTTRMSRMEPESSHATTIDETAMTVACFIINRHFIKLGCWHLNRIFFGRKISLGGAYHSIVPLRIGRELANEVVDHVHHRAMDQIVALDIFPSSLEEVGGTTSTAAHSVPADTLAAVVLTGAGNPVALESFTVLRELKVEGVGSILSSQVETVRVDQALTMTVAFPHRDPPIVVVRNGRFPKHQEAYGESGATRQQEGEDDDDNDAAFLSRRRVRLYHCCWINCFLCEQPQFQRKV